MNDGRVSTLELFFDLVFVFTITQLTSVLANGGLGEGLLHGGVMLGLVFWMYDGYAWLTNSVPMGTTPRSSSRSRSARRGPRSPSWSFW